MPAVRAHDNSPVEIAAFVDAVEAFAATLPPALKASFTRDGSTFELAITPPTGDHRKLVFTGNESEFDHTLGKVWTEQIDPARTDLNLWLAALDAVRDGRVREVRDRRTGLIYHLYRLNSRGLRTWVRDGQYSMWHWLRLKIRRVHIHTIPPLVPGPA